MKELGLCGKRPVASGCHSTQAVQAVQPFPEDGVLADNLDLPLPRLLARLRKVSARTYSYVVRSVKMARSTSHFEQRGSAPNFQGDVLTLCTCKHQMRASQSPEEWEDGVWLAGFTGRTIYDGTHWLFYLAKVESAHKSQSALWSSVDAAVRQAKAAHLHYLGDMFKPTTPGLAGSAQYSPNQYHTPPRHTHRQTQQDTGWHNDIKYRLADKYGHPALLVADPRLTFLWDEPMIFLKQNHCRNYLKWSSLQDLLVRLEEVT